MQKPRKRQWALISPGAEAGKSTFLAANARPPIMVVDADSRFDAVEPLSSGPVFYPTQVIDTLDLAEELIIRVPSEGIKSLCWDSLTKIYSFPARMGFMRNRAGKQKHSSSRASEMIDKSNAMTLARDLAILGTDVYYCWHTTEGVDGLGKSEIRDMISGVERDRLMTSVNVTLEFFRDNDRFGIRVARARDFGDRKANVDFTIYDKPGNYWRGAADLLEELIYTPFASREGALRWASKTLEITLEEAEGEYDHFKETIAPKSAGEMFSGWYLHVIKNRTSNPSETMKMKEPIDFPPDTSRFMRYPSPDAPDKTNDVKDARESLADLEKVTIGNVVFGAATAWPIKYTADQALLKLKEYPELPEGVEVRMERVILKATGLNMFDWLGEVVLE